METILRLIAILLLVALGGCEGSVLDPAPYDPRVPPVAAATSPVSGAKCPAAAMPIDGFDTLEGARLCLEQLAIGYARQHNTMALQQLAFDLPMIGMGVAALANPIFHGANAATVALGLGSAGVAGAKLYFSPQLRAAAYETAAQSLFCASGVADKLEFVAKEIATTTGAANVANNLAGKITAADEALRTQSSDALNAALVTARTATTDLQNAETLLAYAPSSLQEFALTTMRGATTKVTTGIQDVATVLAQIKATQTTQNGASAGSVPSPAQTMMAVGADATSASNLGALLQASAAAEALAKTINDDWGALAGCTAVYQ